MTWDTKVRVNVTARNSAGSTTVIYEQLGHDVERWRERALELARRREIERDRGRDLGLER